MVLINILLCVAGFGGKRHLAKVDHKRNHYNNPEFSNQDPNKSAAVGT